MVYARRKIKNRGAAEKEGHLKEEVPKRSANCPPGPLGPADPVVLAHPNVA